METKEQKKSLFTASIFLLVIIREQFAAIHNNFPHFPLRTRLKRWEGGSIDRNIVIKQAVLGGSNWTTA